MINKLANIGFIANIVCGVALGVCAIVAECRRHKTTVELTYAKNELALVKANNWQEIVDQEKVDEELNRFLEAENWN